jgi:CDP-diacylglycerol--glycerol-3-phosphate 3-phosphatidyltransferase
VRVTTETNPLHGRFLRRGESQASIMNIANVITIVRILMAPVFIWLLIADDGQLGPMRYAAAILFIVSIATDALDGYLARSRNLVTNFGIFWDPLADKILIGSALIALSILGELWWWVTIVILIREFGITIYRLIALRDRVIPASFAGKAKTMAQAIATSLFLFPLWVLLGDWVHWLNWIAMGIALVLTVYSGFEYLYGAWKLSKRPAPVNP